MRGKNGLRLGITRSLTRLSGGKTTIGTWTTWQAESIATRHRGQEVRLESAPLYLLFELRSSYPARGETSSQWSPIHRSVQIFVLEVSPEGAFVVWRLGFGVEKMLSGKLSKTALCVRGF